MAIPLVCIKKKAFKKFVVVIGLKLVRNKTEMK
jgi:hypothetical protein